MGEIEKLREERDTMEAWMTFYSMAFALANDQCISLIMKSGEHEKEIIELRQILREVRAAVKEETMQER